MQVWTGTDIILNTLTPPDTNLSTPTAASRIHQVHRWNLARRRMCSKDLELKLMAGLKRQAAVLDGCGLNGAAFIRLTDQQLEELRVTPASLRGILLQWK